MLSGPHIYKLDPDSYFYIELSEGKIENTIKPFSTRILHPFTIMMVRYIFPLSNEYLFLAVNMLSLFLFILLLTYLINYATDNIFYSIILIINPCLILIFNYIHISEIYYSMFLVIFLIFLYKKYLFTAMLFLFLLSLIRDNSILVCFATIVASLFEREYKWAVASFVVLILGCTTIFIVGLFGNPNVHGMNDILYMVYKIPYNFLKNVAGLKIWTNTLVDSAIKLGYALPAPPAIKVTVPPWLPLGGIREIGFYPWDPWKSFQTLAFLLTTFSVAPLVLIYDLIKVGKPRRGRFDLWLLVAMIYGLATFVLSTSVGSTVYRLVWFAWPAFWLVAPTLLEHDYQVTHRHMLQLLACHVALTWLLWPLALWYGEENKIMLIFAASVLIYWFSFKILKQSLNDRSIIAH